MSHVFTMARGAELPNVLTSFREMASRIVLICAAACFALLVAACGGNSDPSPEPFAITAQPIDTSVVAGRAAVFSVNAPGAAGYQWQLSTNAGAAWTNLAGGTAATYTADIAAASGTRYRVVVAGPGGSSVTSSAVTLTVTAAVVAPAITMQPADQTAVEGRIATFSVTATGTSLAYQWQASGDGGVTYADVAGATDPTLSLTAVALADNGKRVRVGLVNSAGSVMSNAAALAVTPMPAAPAFATQPVSASVTAPMPATFTVVALGTPTPTLQWQLSTNAGVAWVDIAGATNATFTTPATSTAQSGYQYRALATNNVASTNSSAVALTVAVSPVAPAFTVQPVATSVTAPTPATFTVTFTGTPTPALQWQLSIDGGASYANINGATAATFTTAATTASDDGRLYRVVASNATASMASNSALLTVSALSGTSVGPAGGTVNGPNGTQLVIPAGALATTLSFAITQSSVGAPSFPSTGFTAIGATYTITPHGTAFRLPATVRMPYSAAAITDGATPQLLKAEPGGAFAAVPSTENGAFVEAAIGNLSYFVAATNGLLRFSDVSGKCGRESLTGTIWCWGAQGSIAFNSGATPLGDNEVATFARPTRLSTLAFGEFVAGPGFVCGVHATDVYCIGDTEITREMNPPLVAHWVKMAFPVGISISRLAASGSAVCGVVGSGPATAYCWGSNLAGQLGRGLNSASSFDPAPVMGGSSDYVAIAGAGLTFCGLRLTGSLECWGAGNQGEIPGSPSFTNLSPVAVTGVSLDPRQGALAAGTNHLCGLSTNGSVTCWGLNFSGQIGVGTAGNGNASDPQQVKAPVMVPGLTLASIRLVNNTTCGLTPARALFCWGQGASGNLGNGTHPAKQTTPVAVATPAFSLLRLSGAGDTVCGLTSTAEAYCWGSNTYAGLGSNVPPPASSDIPIKVWDIGPFPSLP